MELNGHCTEKQTYFYDFEVPGEDFYQIGLFIGGYGDELEESLYGGEGELFKY